MPDDTPEQRIVNAIMDEVDRYWFTVPVADQPHPAARSAEIFANFICPLNKKFTAHPTVIERARDYIDHMAVAGPPYVAIRKWLEDQGWQVDTVEGSHSLDDFDDHDEGEEWKRRE